MTKISLLTYNKNQKVKSLLFNQWSVLFNNLTNLIENVRRLRNIPRPTYIVLVHSVNLESLNFQKNHLPTSTIQQKNIYITVLPKFIHPQIELALHHSLPKIIQSPQVNYKLFLINRTRFLHQNRC